MVDFKSKLMGVRKKVELDFERVDTRHPVTNEPVVCFTHHWMDGEQEKTFTVRASIEGVELYGESPVIRDNYELEPLGKVMGLAMKEHVKRQKQNTL